MKRQIFLRCSLSTTRTCAKFSKSFYIFETRHAAVVARLIAVVLAHEQSIQKRLLFLNLDTLALLRRKFEISQLCHPRDSAIVCMLALLTILSKAS